MSRVDDWLAAFARGETAQIACCPEHGLHGERAECFHCGAPAALLEVRGIVNFDEHGQFDPDELVRWAEHYGHPEGWAKRAQAAHVRAEKLASRVDVLERALRQIGEHPRLAVQIVAEVLGEPLALEPLSPPAQTPRDLGTL